MTVKINNPAPNIRTVVASGYLMGRPTGSQGPAQQVSIRSIQPTSIYRARLKAGSGINITGNVISASSGGSGINQLTGDVTAGPGIGSQVATLATVAGSPGTFASVTFNGKGLTTSGANLSGYGTTSGSVLTVTKVQGTTAGGNATAGDVGEYISSVVLLASEVNINSAANVAQLTSLPAGDWDVWGEAWLDTNTGTATVSAAGFRAGLTTTTGVLPSVPADNTARVNAGLPTVPNSQQATVYPVGPIRISQSSANTVFLVAACTVSAGTAFGYGKICARRVR